MSKKELALSVPAARANGGIYYGWVVLGVAFATATVTFAVSYYSFSVLLKPMSAQFN